MALSLSQTRKPRGQKPDGEVPLGPCAWGSEQVTGSCQAVSPTLSPNRAAGSRLPHTCEERVYRRQIKNRGSEPCLRTAGQAGEQRSQLTVVTIQIGFTMSPQSGSVLIPL